MTSQPGKQIIVNYDTYHKTLKDNIQQLNCTKTIVTRGYTKTDENTLIELLAFIDLVTLPALIIVLYIQMHYN